MKFTSSARSLLAASLLLLDVSGCAGEDVNPVPGAGSSSALGSAQPSSQPSSLGSGQACDAPAPREAPLRRLSNYEYQNTLADLGGDAELAARVSRDLIREPTSLGFRNSATALTIPPLLADKYVQAALEMAHALPDVPGWITCDLKTVDPACITTFFQTLGQRAYRRPLTSQELRRFSDLYNEAIEREADVRKAVEWVTASLLSSSHFLFRVELEQSPGVRRPLGYEMASRLSYLLWQTMPDVELFRAAEVGELDTDAGIEVQVKRMIVSPKAFRVYEFFEQWLDIDELGSVTRDANVYPESGAHLNELLAAESRAFVYELLSKNGTLKDLFSAEYTLANHDLALHYGLSTPPAGADFVKVATPGRSGILTQAGLLVHDHAGSTSMVRRGLKLRTDFLCQIVPAPPADVDVSPPVIDGEFTQRERLDLHRTKPSCAGCHNLMDPIGALFDGFDALGRPRTMDEAGAAIESGGDVVGSLDVDGHYDSVPELGVALSGSAEVQACVVRQAFRFFYGRELTAQDKCVADQIMGGFERNGFRLSDLILSLTRSDQFRFRMNDAQDPGDSQ